MQEAVADGWQRMGQPGAVPPCVSCVQPAYLLAGATVSTHTSRHLPIACCSYRSFFLSECLWLQAAWSSGDSSGVLWRHKDTPQTAKAVLSLKAASTQAITQLLAVLGRC